MPRNVQQLRIFLASPSDVGPERDRVEKVVRELNFSTSRDGLVLELVRWETHAHPDFGQYPQAVINDQIGADFDVFIGILWSRVGTPTPRFPSGTLEEFRLAYKRWQADNSSLTLMLYFKDEPISPSQLDAGQLGQIQTFKKELPSSGGFYWLFKTIDEFETDLKLHLANVVQRWRRRLNNLSSGAGEGAAFLDQPMRA